MIRTFIYYYLEDQAFLRMYLRFSVHLLWLLIESNTIGDWIKCHKLCWFTSVNLKGKSVPSDDIWFTSHYTFSLLNIWALDRIDKWVLFNWNEFCYFQLRLMAEKASIEASKEVVEDTIEDVGAEVEEDFQEGSKTVYL